MHYEVIPSAVSRFRHDGCRPEFHKNTLVNPLYGGQNLVFRLAFPDDTKWAVRMPVHLPLASAIPLIGEENALLRRLEDSGFAWAPKLVGEELNCENPVGFPFTVYRWIPGMLLQWNDCIPSKREDRDKVTKQLAHILVSLISCTGKQDMQSQSGRLLDRLIQITDHRIVRICCGDLRGFRIRDCFYHQNLLPHAVDNDLECAPHFIGHRDLAAIVDWSFAAYEHFQLAASLPRILRFKENSDILITESSLGDYNIILKLIKLYSHPNLDYREQVIEAAVSKGAFSLLAKTFPQRELLDLDFEIEIRRFLSRTVGQRSGLTEEDLLRYL
ncbi:hypothetical protein K469DRAFT_728104 [Zopfia rhizophila CBS 207.26]|uniref:Aminoglycoside phosphotransferase domain-containing protein n=1 Tax=Zopfia rhizophila CBS 207.26 TaxID=1314779 RepID=A0A6A6DX61_9PEZI|nr:hypothetical protein K469DRAFT_728104 [Zopfia rhizophila CBS 207.26]